MRLAKGWSCLQPINRRRFVVNKVLAYLRARDGRFIHKNIWGAKVGFKGLNRRYKRVQFNSLFLFKTLYQILLQEGPGVRPRLRFNGVIEICLSHLINIPRGYIDLW